MANRPTTAADAMTTSGPNAEPGVRNSPDGLAIEVTDLSIDYGSLRAVSDVSFSLDAGSTTALLGRNGAGKSTILKALLGLVAPTHGEARLFGSSVHARRSVLNRVGYLPQSSGLIALLRVKEHVARVANVHLNGDSDREVAEVLERLGIESLADRPCSELSGGQRRLVQLAMALVHHPSLLVLDEPTNALDAEAQQTLIEVVNDERNRGTTLLLCSHRLEEVTALTDHVLVLNSGRVVRSDAVAALLSADARLRIRASLADSATPAPLWTKVSPDLYEADTPLTDAAIRELANRVGWETRIELVSESGASTFSSRLLGDSNR